MTTAVSAAPIKLAKIERDMQARQNLAAADTSTAIGTRGEVDESAEVIMRAAMPVPDLSDAIGELPPDDLVEAGVYPSERSAAEHGLVVLASGRPYWLWSAGDTHRLLVESGAFEA